MAFVHEKARKVDNVRASNRAEQERCGVRAACGSYALEARGEPRVGAAAWIRRDHPLLGAEEEHVVRRVCARTWVRAWATSEQRHELKEKHGKNRNSRTD